jgi:hypothetical protein
LTLADRLDPVAVYAAVVSTIVLGWQIFVWFRTGPRLKLSASSNMKTFGGIKTDDNTYITLNVRNVGTQQTTITHVLMFSYKNRWKWFRRKPETTGFINHGVAAYPIPHVLGAGQTFMSMARQTVEIEKRSRDHLLYIGVQHSCCDRPMFARVRPIRESGSL